MPAVQIVDDRYVDWRRTDTATLIADDFFGAASVVGAPVSADELGDAGEPLRDAPRSTAPRSAPATPAT